VTFLLKNLLWIISIDISPSLQRLGLMKLIPGLLQTLGFGTGFAS